MRKHVQVLAVCLLLAVTAFAQQNSSSQGQSAKSQSANSLASSASQTNQQQNIIALPESRRLLGGTNPNVRIAKETIHHLLMLDYYTVFDNLGFRVENGNTVILTGQVVNPVVKNDAQASVKRIEGVEKVVNDIKVLPPSPMDERIRHAEYRTIFSYDGLGKYSWGAVPPVHIVVDNGHVTLVGAVDSKMDKEMITIRANSVPGVFSVKNDLQVINNKQEAKK